MAQENGKQGQSETANEGQEFSGVEPLSSAVKNLVENAINEARASSIEHSVSFIEIEIEEERPAVGERPLKSAATYASGGFKRIAGVTLGASKSLTKGAIHSAKASASAAERFARATANFVQEEDVVESTTVFLGEAEVEGEQAVKSVLEFLGSLLRKR